MKKLIIIFSLIISLTLSIPDNVSADYVVIEASAQFKRDNLPIERDYRVQILTAFFESYNSPLTDSAEIFIKKADQYNLDWRFVPAITGVESTFGKRIPPNSYNAYGWANGAYSFESWEDSIEIVSKTLREKYIDKGAVSFDQIARRYAPPSSTWSFKVKYFMNKIDPLPLTFTI